MSERSSRAPRRLPLGPVALAALGLVALGGLAACGTSPSPSPTPGGGLSLTPVPGGSPSAAPPSQTDTEWGRIWDALPPRYPTPPGAEPTVTRSGPASAVLAVPGSVEATVDWLRTALPAAGYSTDAIDGPLEDGSWVIESTIPGGDCRVRSSVAPEGGSTVLIVMYGAGCPFE